jgi:hypothetical protein
MYFWNIRKLLNQLANGGISERASLFYILINLGLVYVACDMYYWFPSEVDADLINIWDYLISASGYVSMFALSLIAYRINGGSQGRDFMERFVSIYTVVGIRILAVALLIVICDGFLYTQIESYYGIYREDYTSASEATFIIGTEMAALILVCKYFKALKIELAAIGSTETRG